MAKIKAPSLEGKYVVLVRKRATQSVLTDRYGTPLLYNKRGPNMEPADQHCQYVLQFGVDAQPEFRLREGTAWPVIEAVVKEHVASKREYARRAAATAKRAMREYQAFKRKYL